MERISSMMRSKMPRTASVGEGTVVGAGDIGEDLIFAFRFVNGEFGLAFDAADVLHDGGAFIEQGDDAAVHVVDQRPILFELGLGFFEGHAVAPKPLLSSRVKASSLASSAGSAGVLLDQADEGATDDDGLHEAAEFGDVRWFGDAEADGERETGGGADRLDEGRDGCRERILHAGDTGARDQIDETSGVLRHEFNAAFGAGGRGEEDGIQAVAMHGVYVGFGFFDAGVDEQAAIDAGGRGVGGEAFQAIAQDGVEIGEEQEWNFGSRANLARDFEHGGEGGAGLEGTLAAALDDGAIADGVAKGHAELDQVGAAAHQGVRRGRGCGSVRDRRR